MEKLVLSIPILCVSISFVQKEATEQIKVTAAAAAEAKAKEVASYSWKRIGKISFLLNLLGGMFNMACYLNR
jgi:hypothetical protein